MGFTKVLFFFLDVYLSLCGVYYGLLFSRPLFFSKTFILLECLLRIAFERTEKFIGMERIGDYPPHRLALLFILGVLLLYGVEGLVFCFILVFRLSFCSRTHLLEEIFGVRGGERNGDQLLDFLFVRTDTLIVFAQCLSPLRRFSVGLRIEDSLVLITSGFLDDLSECEP